MNKTDNLEELLDKLGITKADLSKSLEVRPNTITNWSKGKVPKVVVIYLRLLIEVRQLGRI